MAIRRSPDFRFDFFLRSLPTEVIGRRCEQLMKAAEKEIEQMTKKAREDAGFIEEEKKENSPGESNILPEVELPRFKDMKEAKRKEAKEEIEMERKQLESKVEEIESTIEEIQNRLKLLQKHGKDFEGGQKKTSKSEFPDDLLPELANVVAKSGSLSVTAIANQFVEEYGQPVPKKTICAKIEDIAKKERRKEEGDLRAVWHVLSEYMNLLNVETIRHLRKEKEHRLEKKRSGTQKKRNSTVDDSTEQHEDGASGPDGEFVAFPPYDGTEEPRECKKAFTLFCTGTRKEVKRSLEPSKRKDKHLVNGILKQRWHDMSDEEKIIWKKWQVWDQLRYNRDCAIYRNPKKSRTSMSRAISKEDDSNSFDTDMTAAKKRKGDDTPDRDGAQGVNANMAFHI
eukprot:CAMPEP_0204619136 /NCGR_PEP_ID=MMETSP0717-20131115/5590_1 /ASSEMBLY_ACC=CAM_ASM_000666 /TAXON_ID=230516 /ORGANISM="Chaetoceros curvisetus" /LENGTH=396 /DNA_ID=CAMNT_0051633053 /DNA_START=246 /DNA_END=1433 /DNA_ORIENTATION=+